jgi:hypothetical protein
MQRIMLPCFEPPRLRRSVWLRSDRMWNACQRHDARETTLD